MPTSGRLNTMNIGCQLGTNLCVILSHVPTDTPSSWFVQPETVWSKAATPLHKSHTALVMGLKAASSFSPSRANVWSLAVLWCSACWHFKQMLALPWGGSKNLGCPLRCSEWLVPVILSCALTRVFLFIATSGQIASTTTVWPFTFWVSIIQHQSWGLESNLITKP